MKQSTIFFTVIAILVIGLAAVALIRDDSASVGNVGPGQYDGFAQCLNDNGAVFYGAFWCPHCKDQKKLFGNSQKLLNYVECSTPDGQGRTPACIEKNIDSYPTWEFADGERLNGTIPLEQLAEKTSCALPS